MGQLRGCPSYWVRQLPLTVAGKAGQSCHSFEMHLEDGDSENSPYEREKCSHGKKRSVRQSLCHPHRHTASIRQENFKSYLSCRLVISFSASPSSGLQMSSNIKFVYSNINSASFHMFFNWHCYLVCF